MIKIIEPGTKTVAECNSCGCKFSYEKEDIQLPIFFEPYVTCPQCGKTLTVMSIKGQKA